MSIFAETVSRAISDYRRILRRNLNQTERLRKLEALRLKDPNLFDSDVNIYQAAWAIIHDIEETTQFDDSGYYAYSGIAKFSEYLKEYLDNYEIEANQVVHRAQKASRALLKAIQLVTMPRERLDETVLQQMLECNEMIAAYGSYEQRELHKQNLERQEECDQSFYGPIRQHFVERISLPEAA